MRYSGRALVHGDEKHVVDGVTIRVTSPARTVADCFRYRSKVGTDVAVEALRDYRRLSKDGIDALWKAAEIRGVKALIRPYLEALA